MMRGLRSQIELVRVGTLGKNVTFDLSVSALKAEICKEKKNRLKMAKIIDLSVMKLKQKVGL